MDNLSAIAALAALAQPTRLEAFRLLVRHEPGGLPAGELAGLLGVPQNTLSVHLAVLSRAGLVTFERRGRLMIYRALLLRVRDLMLFLAQDCCGGNVGACAPLIADLAAGCIDESSCHEC